MKRDEHSMVYCVYAYLEFELRVVWFTNYMRMCMYTCVCLSMQGRVRNIASQKRGKHGNLVRKVVCWRQCFLHESLSLYLPSSNQ